MRQAEVQVRDDVAIRDVREETELVRCGDEAARIAVARKQRSAEFGVVGRVAVVDITEALIVAADAEVVREVPVLRRAATSTASLW